MTATTTLHCHEPWRMDMDLASDTTGQILDGRGVVVVDPYGSTLEEFSEEARYMRRIVACVNACAGVATEALEEYARSLEPKGGRG